MKLIYNVVINSHVDTVWKLLTNLENQEIFIDILSIEKSSLNTYVFHFKNKFKTNSYHTLLLDKKDSRKLSFAW